MRSTHTPLTPNFFTEDPGEPLNQENTIGVVEVTNKADKAHYTEDDVAILELPAACHSLILWSTNQGTRVQSVLNGMTELERLKSNFIATISHELRTLLGPIFGHATFSKNVVPEEHRKPIDTIIRNATRHNEIVEGLTDMDNYESGLLRLR